MHCFSAGKLTIYVERMVCYDLASDVLRFYFVSIDAIADRGT